MIPVYRTKAADTQFSRDWYGNEAPFQAQYRFELKKSVLTYSFSAAKESYASSHPRGAFVEGLWEYDVAEFFVQQRGSESYLEFNISPNGAWWCALFSGYRKREREFRINPEAIEVGPGWRIEFSITLGSLAPVISNFEESLLCATAILFEGGQPTYLCSGPKLDSEPDFHARENFLPIQLR